MVVLTVGYISREMEQYTVSEDEGSVEACWNLAPADIAFERTVEFLANTEFGSAMALDLSSLSSVPVFPTDQNSLCVIIEIENDSNIEETEDFMVNLSSSDSAVHFTSNSSLIRVSDNVLVCILVHRTNAMMNTYRLLSKMPLPAMFSSRILFTK